MENFVNITPVGKSFANDARSASQSFGTGERKALSATLGFAAKVVEHGDVQQLDKLLNGGFGYFSPTVVNRMIKVVRTVINGVNISELEAGGYAVSTSKKKGRNFKDAWTLFATASNDGKGIFHPDLMPNGETKDKPFDVKASAKSLVKRARKAEIALADLITAVTEAYNEADNG